ncbi:methylated-DNA--[protein]-cysteine S-methyltransferase [Agrilactobacillus yilanensis]|uniref:Methylated-DNA--protein-cysteine methyltransferase n=1 Tax=Agrilactobacillus yilanensis TaxID=2485997 RepID=A0ABW4J592_9LACO|nr:methylated-DNA--[protein]-cysteine S-methyltransferase [Agrilactobacillus yilanensis]
MFYRSTYQTPLGTVILLSDATALRGLWFADQKYCGAQYDLEKTEVQDAPPITAAKTWLTQYFAGEKPAPTQLTLAPEVTPFRQRVLNVLQTIPYGTTTTYQAIAQQLSGTNLSRAVGGAVGHNPISIIIPCHRVLGSDGALTGYAGGVDRKIELLRLEGLNNYA